MIFFLKVQIVFGFSSKHSSLHLECNFDVLKNFCLNCGKLWKFSKVFFGKAFFRTCGMKLRTRFWNIFAHNPKVFKKYRTFFRKNSEIHKPKRFKTFLQKLYSPKCSSGLVECGLHNRAHKFLLKICKKFKNFYFLFQKFLETILLKSVLRIRFWNKIQLPGRLS